MRVTGEVLNMFSELTLSGIHKAIKNKAMNLTEIELREQNGSDDEEITGGAMTQSALAQLDSFLMLYATMAINEIQ